jgi:hypothetical protein
VASTVAASQTASADVGSAAANTACQGQGLTGVLTCVEVKDVSASNAFAGQDFNIWLED